MNQQPAYTAVFANTWGGRLIDDHLEQVTTYNHATDLGFYAEVHHLEGYADEPVRVRGPNLAEPPMTLNQYELLQQRLPDHQCHFNPARQHVIPCAEQGIAYTNVGFGNVRTYTHTLPVLDHGSPTVFGTMGEKPESGINPRALDYIVIGGRERTVVAHLHGVWIEGNTKGDAPERDEQSAGVRRILRILGEQYSTDRIILGGDFNLELSTNALRHLEEGYREGDVRLHNLIREYDIHSTRTCHYRNYGKPDYSLFADYVLVSDAIEVINFESRTDSASDHMHQLLTWR